MGLDGNYGDMPLDKNNLDAFYKEFWMDNAQLDGNYGGDMSLDKNNLDTFYKEFWMDNIIGHKRKVILSIEYKLEQFRY